MMLITSICTELFISNSSHVYDPDTELAKTILLGKVESKLYNITASYVAWTSCFTSAAFYNP